jgi:hypothetical protein
MSNGPTIDPDAIRQFITIVSQHAQAVTNGATSPGVINLDRIDPRHDDKVLTQPFAIDDVEHMVEAAVTDAEHCNVYIEARTVRSGLPRGTRGGIGDTACVLALVVDSDADKNKACTLPVRPSIVVETSPGNHHLWFLLSRALSAGEAQPIGDAMRAASGADADTGVITQFYRVPGTPNYPNATKQARGRTTIESTRLIESSGRLWTPEELLAAFTSPPGGGNGGQATFNFTADESSLPADLLADIVNGGSGHGTDKSRSALFFAVVKKLKQRNWSIEDIVRLLQKYPQGVGAKYQGKRLKREIARAYSKVNGGIAPPSPPPPPPQGTGSAAASNPSPGSSSPVLPTIRLEGGQLVRAIEETEAAIIASGQPIFARAGLLCRPTPEWARIADDRRILIAQLVNFAPDSFLEPVARSAIFQKFNIKKDAWVDCNPPVQLVRALLSRAQSWHYPHVSGIVTTSILRADGSLLDAPGYDARSELYLMPGLCLPSIPERPTEAEAREALKLLHDLFSEFCFRTELDRAIALSGLLTALLRGSMRISPLHLFRAQSGVGKSYLVDLISIVVTGQECPVIKAHSEDKAELRKIIDAKLLGGRSLVSIDNIEHDLGGDIICQLVERAILAVRPLGHSKDVDCENRLATFATGINVGFKADATRRGLLCVLETREELPEYREFKRETMRLASDKRGDYIAAAYTIVRHYLVQGAPKVCEKPIGSYGEWSRMVRSPLVFLGERDPVESQQEIRDADPLREKIREFVQLWLDYDLGLDAPYTVARIIELACHQPSGAAGFNLQPPRFKDFLLTIAKGGGAEISRERFGWWLRRVGGQPVHVASGGYRLIAGRDPHSKVATYMLTPI